MAVLIERIAMILSVLRSPSISSELYSDNPSLSGARDVRPENIFCSDTDYATAELIGNKLILHMAQAQGISRATALRWNDEWQNHGFIQKIKYGVYKKIA